MRGVKLRFNKVAIIGVGEIGGSIGKDLRKKRLAKEVVGIGRRRSSLSKAKRMKAVDTTTMSLRNGVKDADLIILATPVLRIVKLGRKAAAFAKNGAIITDVGSTKRYIVENLEKAFPKGVKFVGSHPMAGSERGGPLSAANDLFKGRVCFITRTKRTDKRALAEIKSFWRSLGAKIVELSPDRHDRIVAQVSHMVHVVASGLVISNRNALKYTASGFRDATRIALSDSGLWTDICVTNSKEIARSLDATIKILRKFKSAVSRKKTAQIQRMLNQARLLRQAIS